MDIPAFDGFSGKKADGSPFRILIVDDSPFMIKQMVRFVEALKCEVAGTAQDGLEAVQLYPNLKPDVVTLDITMPKMDGIQTLEKLIEMDSQAKIVMVSALGHEDMVKQSILKGAMYFIVKPLTLSKVTQTLVPVLKKLSGTEEE